MEGETLPFQDDAFAERVRGFQDFLDGSVRITTREIHPSFAD
jgi:hypothetical protein